MYRNAHRNSGACTCVIQTFENGKVRHLAVNACLFPLVGGQSRSFPLPQFKLIISQLSENM